LHVDAEVHGVGYRLNPYSNCHGIQVPALSGQRFRCGPNGPEQRIDETLTKNLAIHRSECRGFRAFSFSGISPVQSYFALKSPTPRRPVRSGCCKPLILIWPSRRADLFRHLTVPGTPGLIAESWRRLTFHEPKNRIEQSWHDEQAAPIFRFMAGAFRLGC
jgi:hypothetical protein